MINYYLMILRSGIRYFDIVDNYINNWGMVLIGFLECFAIGWVYKIEDQYAVVCYIILFLYFIVGTVV